MCDSVAETVLDYAINILQGSVAKRINHMHRAAIFNQHFVCIYTVRKKFFLQIARRLR